MLKEYEEKLIKYSKQIEDLSSEDLLDDLIELKIDKAANGCRHNDDYYDFTDMKCETIREELLRRLNYFDMAASVTLKS